MSDSSQVEVVIGEQADKDTPATTGEVLFRTGGGGDAPTTHEDSDQVRADLKDTGDSMTDQRPTYSYDSYVLHNANRQAWRSVLKAPYLPAVTVTGVAGDITFVDAGNKLTSTTANKFNAIVVGRPIFISGSLAANNGWALPLSKVTGAAPELVLDWLNLVGHVPAGAAAVIIQEEHIVEGTETDLYFTIEERYADLDLNHIDSYIGMKGERISETIPLPGTMTSSFGFQGIKYDAGRDVTIFSGAITPVTTNPQMNGARNILDIREGGVLGPYEFGEIRLEINSGVRPRGALGTFGPVRVGTNKFRMSGGFNVYNDENVQTLRAKRDGHTPTSLAYILRDDNGDEELRWWPYIYLRTSPRNAGGNDNDVTMNFDFTAKMHPTYGFMFCRMIRPVA